MPKILKFHDEKTFGFWGGIFEMPEPDTDEAQCVEVAAICDNPDAPRRARLFCESEHMLESVEALLEPMDSLLTGVVPEWNEHIEKLHAIVARVKTLPAEGYYAE